MIPILMILHNRLEYSKKAFWALQRCKNVLTYLIDNGSDDGTREWTETPRLPAFRIRRNDINIGIAGAMNQFLQLTRNHQIVGKCDNDTLLPRDFIQKMLPHMEKADIVQAKHPLIAASKVGTFDELVSKMPNITPTLKQNHFIGGSGILFKRQLVNHIPETENKLMGWRQWQRDHPEVKKAFALDCEIELLDEGGYPKEYESYYRQTGRI